MQRGRFVCLFKSMHSIIFLFSLFLYCVCIVFLYFVLYCVYIAFVFVFVMKCALFCASLCLCLYLYLWIWNKMVDYAREGDRFVCLCKSEENDREFLTLGHNFEKHWRAKTFIWKISITICHPHYPIGHCTHLKWSDNQKSLVTTLPPQFFFVFLVKVVT